MTAVPTPHELPNKPLVEAIFELRWNIKQGPDPTTGSDPGFQILLGRFYDKVSHSFPEIVNLPAAQIPEEMVAFTVRQQFRTAPNQWPVVQLGPGIMTVNETQGYTSDGFKACVQRCVGALFESYPANLAELRPRQLSLRYVNAVPYDKQPGEVLNFLRENLHTDIVIDPLLYEESAGGVQPPIGLNLNLSFPVPALAASISTSFSTGLSSGKKAIVWQLTAQTAGEPPNDPSSIDTWVSSLHALIEQWFFTLARGELIERFGGSRDA